MIMNLDEMFKILQRRKGKELFLKVFIWTQVINYNYSIKRKIGNKVAKYSIIMIKVMITNRKIEILFNRKNYFLKT